jgi:tripartite-type tricarboxylate transporter receptor subunit TctC
MNRGFGCLVAGLALFAASTPAFAQAAYPTRPIRVIVPYPAGGIVDIVARSVTDTIGKYFKQAMVVEAKPGGNSNIGTAEVARSTPDGYT